MSYNLCFWQQADTVHLSPQLVYQQLCAGQLIQGLNAIDCEQFLRCIRQGYPHSEQDVQGALYWAAHGRAFQADAYSQYVLIQCFGTPNEWMNQFIEIGSALGYPLYDPQINQRFVSHP